MIIRNAGFDLYRRIDIMRDYEQVERVAKIPV